MLLALKLSGYTAVSERDARQIELMEGNALLPLVPVESKRELSSARTHISSLSPSFCRYKAAPSLRTPSVSFSPNQVRLNLSNNKLVQSSNNKLVQDHVSVERQREEKKKDLDASEFSNSNNKVSRSGLVER